MIGKKSIIVFLSSIVVSLNAQEPSNFDKLLARMNIWASHSGALLVKEYRERAMQYAEDGVKHHGGMLVSRTFDIDKGPCGKWACGNRNEENLQPDRALLGDGLFIILPGSDNTASCDFDKEKAFIAYHKIFREKIVSTVWSQQMEQLVKGKYVKAVDRMCYREDEKKLVNFNQLHNNTVLKAAFQTKIALSTLAIAAGAGVGIAIKLGMKSQEKEQKNTVQV